MKIEIFKKENDENIYFSYEGRENLILNFENLKELSIGFLEKKKNEEELTFSVEANAELSLYKTTIEDVLSEICNDEDLYLLYKDKSMDE